MAEGAVRAEDVAGAPSLAFAAYVAGLFEVGDDALRGALGDAADRGDVAEPGGRVARDNLARFLEPPLSSRFFQPAHAGIHNPGDSSGAGGASIHFYEHAARRGDRQRKGRAFAGVPFSLARP